MHALFLSLALFISESRVPFGDWWSKPCRQLLCTVVRIKMTMYDASDARTQSAEEYLKAYLETEVRTLWPQGWMQARSVYSAEIQSCRNSDGLK